MAAQLRHSSRSISHIPDLHLAPDTIKALSNQINYILRTVYKHTVRYLRSGGKEHPTIMRIQAEWEVDISTQFGGGMDRGVADVPYSNTEILRALQQKVGIAWVAAQTSDNVSWLVSIELALPGVNVPTFYGIISAACKNGGLLSITYRNSGDV